MSNATLNSAMSPVNIETLHSKKITNGTALRIIDPQHDSESVSSDHNQYHSKTKNKSSESDRAASHGARVMPHIPFEPVWHYPSTFERIAYKTHIALFNRLWPIRPRYFGGALAAVLAYNIRFSSNALLSLVPNAESLGFRIVRIGLVSFATVYLPIVALRYALKHFFFGYQDYVFENPLKPSFKTKLWRITNKILSYAPRRLESCSALLPNLPLPRLTDSVERYLNDLEPLVSEDEHKDVKKKAEEFMRRDGKILQLLTWIYSCFVDNYVTPFWVKYGYLASRDGVLINTSFGHCDTFQEDPNEIAEKVAEVFFLEALSMIAVDRENISALGHGLMCAEHFKRYYTTTRVPGQYVDKLKSHYLSKHFVILCNGFFYKIDAFDENNQLYSIQHFVEVLREILSRSDKPSDCEDCIAALTTDSRPRWCENRRKFFLENNINRAALEIIETAISFGSIENLDFFSPMKSHSELFDYFDKYMLVGNGKNIWADKSVCFSVSRNGRWGGANEHSTVDAIDCDLFLENFVFMKYCLSHDPINAEKLEGPTRARNISEQKKSTSVERLKFDISDEMKSEITRCYSEYKPQADDVDMASLCYTEFGKGLIKKGKISPDAFFQMALQLTHFKDQGKFVHTYESASTRLFANSRTETLRSVTKESCEFVRAMLDDDITNEERLRLLRLAAEKHVKRNRECMVGKGYDRHLFVLYVFSKMIGLSSPFLDYFITQGWPLSTSQAPKVTSIPNEDKHVDLSWFGGSFAAVKKDGYGVCYRFAGNHSICVHITSYHSASNTDSHRFKKHLIESFRQMASLFATNYSHGF